MTVPIGIKRLAAMRAGQMVHGIAAMLDSAGMILPPCPAAQLAAKSFPAPGSRLFKGLSAAWAAVARFGISGFDALAFAEIPHSIPAQARSAGNGFISLPLAAQLLNLPCLPFGHKSAAPFPNDECTESGRACESARRFGVPLLPCRSFECTRRVCSWKALPSRHKKRAGIVFLALSISGDCNYSTDSNEHSMNQH